MFSLFEKTHPFMGFDIPISLMRLTGGGPETFDSISATHISNLKALVGLEPHYRVLEVGCGIGRDAIPLAGILGAGSYLGVDITKKSIDWCSRQITRKFPNFRFLHLDIANSLYNPKGTVEHRDVRFPLQDGSVDRIILQSVFTHLLEPDVIHYLREFKRLLSPAGAVYATFFIYDDAVLESASRTKHRGLTFKYEIADRCRTSDKKQPLNAIAYTSDKLVEMLHSTGLSLKNLHRGAWSGHFANPPDGQDVAIIASR